MADETVAPVQAVEVQNEEQPANETNNIEEVRAAEFDKLINSDKQVAPVETDNPEVNKEKPADGEREKPDTNDIDESLPDESEKKTAGLSRRQRAIAKDLGIDPETATDREIAIIENHRKILNSKSASRPSYAFAGVSSPAEDKSKQSALEKLEAKMDDEFLDEAFKSEMLSEIKAIKESNTATAKRLAEYEQREIQESLNRKTSEADSFFGSLSVNDYPIFGKGTIDDIDAGELEARNSMVECAESYKTKNPTLTWGQAFKKALLELHEESYRAAEERKAKRRIVQQNKSSAQPASSMTKPQASMTRADEFDALRAAGQF